MQVSRLFRVALLWAAATASLGVSRAAAGAHHHGGRADQQPTTRPASPVPATSLPAAWQSPGEPCSDHSCCPDHSCCLTAFDPSPGLPTFPDAALDAAAPPVRPAPDGRFPRPRYLLPVWLAPPSSLR
ncbi:MAG: hypothetical protein R2882_02115 [Gemmatimonadales bacterium]